MTRTDAAALGRQARIEARAERAERVALVAAMRLWPGPESVPLPGYVTSAQAAQRIGVCQRTVERYRAVLRAGMLP
jgi:hypothetical protein